MDSASTFDEPTFYETIFSGDLGEQYHHMSQQVASGAMQAPIGLAQCHPVGFHIGIPGEGPGVETSGAHAPEGTQTSSRDQGHDRLQRRSPTRSNKRSGGNKRLRCEWSDAETDLLVKWKSSESGRPRKRKGNGKANRTRWEQIRAILQDKFGDHGQAKSRVQIRRKWDTILKSYKKIKRCWGHRNYSQLADKDFDDDVRGLKLAMRLTREWYIIIDQCQVSSQQPIFQTLGSLDSHVYVASDQSSPIQMQAYSQLPASLQSASPGIGRNSPSHSQIISDHPPFGSLGYACGEITPDNNHRQPQSRFPSGASPAIVMRQSEGQSAPTTCTPWIDLDLEATNRADILHEEQNEANNIDHPRVQNSSPGTGHYPFADGQANHYRPPFGHLGETGVHFRSGDGHLHAENTQIERGGTLHVITGDQGQSGQLAIAAPSIAPTQSPGFLDEAQQLGARRPPEQVAISYFNSLPEGLEPTSRVLLELIKCNTPDILRDVCQLLASWCNDERIKIIASAIPDLKRFRMVSEIMTSVLLQLIKCDIPDNLRDHCEWLAIFWNVESIDIMASLI